MSEKRSSDQIASSLRSIRTQLDGDLHELEATLRGSRSTILGSLIGLGVVTTFFLVRMPLVPRRLVRRPLLGAVRALTSFGVSLVLPLLLDRLRRGADSAPDRISQPHGTIDRGN